MQKIVLASASPRRKELLGRFISNFDIISADIDEVIDLTNGIAKGLEKLALEKAQAVAHKVDDSSVIIAADTVVILDGQILTKPESGADAVNMLKALSGKKHSVITAVAVIKGVESHAFSAESHVYFKDLEERHIKAYVATGEPLDKAGAYAVQGLASIFIDKIEGDYDNIVGLPVGVLMRFFLEKGFLSEPFNN